MKADLTVWWGLQRVGTLSMDAHGEMRFTYADSWLESSTARPVSQSLPLRKGAYSRREARPFFAGLLPDETIREAVSRVLCVSERNDFSLLQALGGEVAGALSLLPEGATPASFNGPVADKPLRIDALSTILEQLPRRPFLAGENGLRLSLAGAQSKLPVVLVGGQVALPAPGQPTSHILKPDLPAYPGSTENEAFVMMLSAAVGLPTAKVMPCRIPGRSYLLVERYDRVLDQRGMLFRLHQEDFCQALGIAPEQKYASEGGPVLRDCFSVLRATATRPAAEVLHLLDAVLFNLIVGNADAHGKNFSLLYKAGGEITLAPLYDLLCTVAYPELSSRFAMKFGGAAEFRDITERSWAKFADNVGLRPPYVRRRIKDLCAAVIKQTPCVAQKIVDLGFEASVLNPICNLVMRRAEILTMKA